MSDLKQASDKALELIILQRAKQQAYVMLAQESTSDSKTTEYWEQANKAHTALSALIDMATQAGLLSYDDANVYDIRLISEK